MSDDRPAIGPAAVLVFVAELAVYVGVGWALGHRHWWMGLLGVVAMAAWWGCLHAPRARWHLPAGADGMLRGIWFGIGLAALVWMLV